MKHKNQNLELLLGHIDFGSSVAETDNLLEAARIETSVFFDLYNDKVDLIPGTKGSGKSALFRIFVEFLPSSLRENKRIVVAHGVQREGDTIFQAFKNEFEKLSEDEFLEFWCIYLVSLSHEHFIKNPANQALFSELKAEIQAFKRACERARIPEIKATKSLYQILEWSLNVLKTAMPSKVRLEFPLEQGALELDGMFPKEDKTEEEQTNSNGMRPVFVAEVKETLEVILNKTDHTLWLMVDKLDEIFPRRSDLERRALRGLLRTLRIFNTERIKVKLFLRDDMLENVVSGESGFTALTHVTSKQSDTLRWNEDQILTLIIKRIFSSTDVASYYGVDLARLNSNQEYRREVFYRIFPNKLRNGPNQSATMKWIFDHIADGKGVVTPRDAIDLLSRAKQYQQNIFANDSDGESEYLFSSAAIIHGLNELSIRKKETYLEAEFPHLWQEIRKFENGKTEYDEESLRKILGSKARELIEQLVSIGFLSKKIKSKKLVFWVPYIYRKALNLKQGKS